MTRRPLPDGEPTKELGAVETGALWRHDGHETLVRVANHERDDGYDVVVYRLVGDGSLASKAEVWNQSRMEHFVESDETAWLAGHNFPGSTYGVYADAEPPACPECGAEMEPGKPEYDDRAHGFVCPEYYPTRGSHRGFMTQDEALDQGYYIPVKEYLTRRYGGENASS